MTADDRHASLQTGVCAPWATEADVCNDSVEFEDGMLDRSLLAASDILYVLSGSRWPGTCQDTVRPVLRGLTADYGRPIRPSYPFGGPYGFWSSGGLSSSGPNTGFWMVNRSDRSGGQIIPEITLGAYPLTGIVQILIDGAVLPAVDPLGGFQNYRIDDDRWLVRLANPVSLRDDGWPGLNNMTLPSTEKNTWEVTYTYGLGPPPGGVRAAATLGYQLALSCSPKTAGACRLPSRVTNITRQGVTAILLDPMAFLAMSKTGLYEVDLWLESVNPGKLRRSAHVTSPDIGRRVRRAGV